MTWNAGATPRRLRRMVLRLGAALGVGSLLLASGCSKVPSGWRHTAHYAEPNTPEYFPGPLENHCAKNAALDIQNLDVDPPANIAYRSGNSKFSVSAPTQKNHRLGHRQGIQRLFIGDGPDAGNYFLVSASTHGADPGFEVVKMGWELNDGPLGFRSGPRGAAPPSQNIIRWVPHDNQHSGTHFNHAGGLQVIGRVVAVAFEGYKVKSPGPAGFRLWSLAPYAPVAGELIERQQAAEDGSVEHAGSVGIARVNNGYYVVLVFGRHAREMELFLSTGPYLSLNQDGWQSVGAWPLSHGAGTLAHKKDEWHGYQNTQLITQCDGQLFMLGAVNIKGNDWVHLWRVELEPESLKPLLTRVASRHLFCNSKRTHGRDQCTLKAGGGPYVDEAGQVLFYAVESHSCVAGDCRGARKRDGKHVGIREFAPLARSADDTKTDGPKAK